MSEPIPEWCPYCGAASSEAHPGSTRYTCESQIALRRDGIGMNIQRELAIYLPMVAALQKADSDLEEEIRRVEKEHDI